QAPQAGDGRGGRAAGARPGPRPVGRGWFPPPPPRSGGAPAWDPRDRSARSCRCPRTRRRSPSYEPTAASAAAPATTLREAAARPRIASTEVAAHIAPGTHGTGAAHAILAHAAALGVVSAARAIRRLSVVPEGPRRHLLAAVAAVAARAAGPAGAGHHAAVARPAAGLPAAETAGTHAAAGLEDLLHLRREVAEHVLPHVLHRAAAESTHAGCIATVLA